MLIFIVLVEKKSFIDQVNRRLCYIFYKLINYIHSHSLDLKKKEVMEKTEK